MSNIVSTRELLDARDFWIDGGWVRHYLRVFVVVTTGPSIGGLEVAVTSDGPDIRTPYDISTERDDGATVRRIHPKQQADPRV